MKNKLTILTVVMVMLLITMPAFAKESKIGILINNEIKVIPQEMGQPFSADSRTFVPLRFVSENLGFKVDWDSKTQTATVHSRDGEIKITIGKENITTPKGILKMDVKPFIKDGRTYVPVRFVAEALNFEVDWLSAKNVKDSKKYPYDFYVSIDGKLGNSANNTSESGITNIVSDNPADWPKTDNEFQKHYDLAKNHELIKYLDENYEGKYHLAGYSVSGPFGQKLGSTFAISKYQGGQLSSDVDMYGVDLRETRGHWDITIRGYSVVREGFEQILNAIAGQADGGYIFDYYERGRNPNVDKSEKTDLKANTWVKTPSGREFQIVFEEGTAGIQLLIK